MDKRFLSVTLDWVVNGVVALVITSVSLGFVYAVGWFIYHYA